MQRYAKKINLQIFLQKFLIFCISLSRCLKTNRLLVPKSINMDIDLLSKMVKELILDNDKVVLPGLGAFVAEMVPSTFSDKGYTINPPYRRLYFRSKPDEGDLLAKFYATSNGVDFSVAEKAIRDFISELRTILYTKKTIIFPDLGRMRATKENAVFFVADEDLDIYPEGLGLEPISLKTHQETKEEVEAAIVGLKALVEEPVAEPVVTELPVEPVVTEPSVAVPIAEPIPEPVQTQSKKYFKVIMWVLVSALVLLAAFVAVARLNPDLIDTLLYTPEQLEILNR